MGSKSEVNVTELDFDAIKNNLKTYMKGQSDFSDYNFEGSGLSTIIDLLAYNTHYLAMNANFATNEMFLDSATTRGSVVSHAKSLGYTPRSARAPVARVEITVTNNQLSNLTMPKGTKFSTSVNNSTYGFVTNEDITTQITNGLLIFSNIPIYEGTLTTTKYTVDYNNPEKKYLLANDRADTTTLKVSVQKSATDTTLETFVLANEITGTTGSDPVYFLQETDDGRFEIYFGDDVIGKKLSDGNIVIMEYVVTNKTLANSANQFTVTSINGQTNVAVSTIQSASGGDEAETIQSIKYYAPLSYTAQKRAVTGFDYKQILPTIYPNIKTIQVWGGEDNDPPVYGQVYISISPLQGTFLTEAQKENIVSQLKSYNIASVRPVIVDPENIYIIMDVNFRYDPTTTTKSSGDLETIVANTISEYSNNNLGKFDGMYRFSEISRLIDTSDTSIISNISNIRMYKSQRAQINTKKQYVIKFYNSIYHPHDDEPPVISSTGFTVAGSTATHFIDDDGSGIVRVYQVVAQSRVYVNANAGDINYTTGTITVNDLQITSTMNGDGTIHFFAIPDSNDIVPVRNQLLSIDSGGSRITAQTDQQGSTPSPGSHSVVGTFGKATSGAASGGTTISSTSSSSSSSSSCISSSSGSHSHSSGSSGY